MAFIKHVGRHDNRRVAIIYKQVPDEDHMCLVVYPETLPSLLHDEVMKVLESEVGQNSKDLADALFRHLMADGENALVSLHKGKHMKKVQTKQVIITPNATSSVRLDELNNILKQMEAGESAVKKLADIDANAGILGNNDLINASKTGADVNTTKAAADVLSDADLANQRLEQAGKMRSDAEAMLQEARRLEQEAKSLLPKRKANVRATKKTTA